MIIISTHAPRMIPSEHLSRQRAGMNGIFEKAGGERRGHRTRRTCASLSPKRRAISEESDSEHAFLQLNGSTVGQWHSTACRIILSGPTGTTVSISHATASELSAARLNA